jgi:hypothetical protein
MSDGQKHKHLKHNWNFPHDGDEGESQLHCKPRCRFYEQTGTVNARELLQLKYSKFDGFADVLKAWDNAVVESV